MAKSDSLHHFQGIDVSQAGSASSIVFETLKQAIITGELKDGTPLKQEELAKKFSTSRIPIRESINRLEQEGLVKTIRYKGAVVASISLKEVEEMFDLRALMEREVMLKAVPNLTDDQINEAEKYCHEFASAKTSGEWTDTNRKLHHALFQASDMTFHLSVLNTIYDRTERYLRAQLSFSNGADRAVDEHHTLIELCRARDGAGAAELMFQHVKHAKRSLLEFLPQDSE